MKIQVYLCSSYRMVDHGNATPVRTVDVPDGEATSIGEACHGAFHYGQNEIQAQAAASVSVGDVIVIPTDAGDQHWRVQSVGFKRTAMIRPDFARGCAAADLGSFGKLLDCTAIELDGTTRDYPRHKSRRAASRHYGIGR